MTDKKMKTALIAGASEGIGQELSRIFAREGYDVVLVARNKEKLEKLAVELEQRYGTKATVVSKDLSVRTAPEEIRKELEGKGISVHTLVNNAGYTVYGAFAEADFADQEKMLDVLVYAPTRLTSVFVPGMVERGEGQILNLASTGSYVPCPYEAVYAASKAYVLFFSEAIAEELAGSNVIVTALCPGATRTQFFERSSTQNFRVFEIGMMSPEQVAEIGYRALVAGKRSVVAGIMNKALVGSARVTPHRLLCKLVGSAIS
jgi:short-subunit dehydrogenase